MATIVEGEKKEKKVKAELEWLSRHIARDTMLIYNVVEAH